MEILNEFLFPRILSLVGRIHEPRVRERKQRHLEGLGGRILEIGPGNGINFGYYDRGAELTVVEPNRAMHPTLAEVAARCGLRFAAHGGYAETIELPDASFDTVVSTLVLCSVRDLDRALQQVQRVLVPGGRFIFLEHVGAHEGTRLRKFQSFVKPAWSCLGGGCIPDRDIGAGIERAGFSKLTLERFDTGLPVVAPHIAGYAVKG
jgi:ubiquinone/menaquinone biosynthesis C-methylase UbiE